MLLLLGEEKSSDGFLRPRRRPCELPGGKGSTNSCSNSPHLLTPCRHNQQQLLRSPSPALELHTSRGAATPQINFSQRRDSRGKNRAGKVKATGRT